MSKLLIASLLFAGAAGGQTLSGPQFRELGRACIPDSPRWLVERIVLVESAFHPYALSINYPEAEARRLGLPAGKVFLAKQPTSAEEASRWARELLAQGYTLSIWLMQVSIEGKSTKWVDKLLDPCTNLQAGWSIFVDKFNAAKLHTRDDNEALRMAISAYNTGSLFAGFGNGYVGKVLDY